MFTVKAWGYWCGYTAAQIQLMVADSPIVVYTHGKQAKPSKRQIDKKLREWQEKNANKGEKISLDEILNNTKR